MTHEQFMKNLNVPRGVVDCVLDTDTYNEIDDQFAVSMAMLAPEKNSTMQSFPAASISPRRSRSSPASHRGTPVTSVPREK